MRVRLSFCLVAFVLSGCYQSVPTELARARTGTKLRVSLTDAGSDSLARYLGPGVLAVDGKLISTDQNDLSLAVTQVTMRSGVDQFWKGETVVLPKYAVATVQERKISKPRTILLSAAIITALATVKLSGVGGNNGTRGGNGPPSGTK